MGDLTLLFLTLNKVPPGWAAYHRDVVTAASGDIPVISISKVPVAWGVNLLQTEEGTANIYRQIRRGAAQATTDYVAIVEDDTLYDASHFRLRPQRQPYLYNVNRWVLFTWYAGVYQYKPKPATGCLIARRERLVEDLAQDRVTELLRPGYEVAYSTGPVICLKHPFSHDVFQQRRRTRIRPVQALDLPVWRTPARVMEHWDG